MGWGGWVRECVGFCRGPWPGCGGGHPEPAPIACMPALARDGKSILGPTLHGGSLCAASRAPAITSYTCLHSFCLIFL